MGTSAAVGPPTRLVIALVVTAFAALLGACSESGESAVESPPVGFNEEPEPPPVDASVDVGDVEPYPGDIGCGPPEVDPAVDAGLFVWQACDEPEWTLMLTADAAADAIFAMGRLFSDFGFAGVVPRSVESSDVLNTNDLDLSTYFMLTTASPWDDLFEFTVPAGSSPCIDIAEGPQLYVGPDRIPAGRGTIDLTTLGTCRIPPPYDDCTDPRVNTLVDSGLFVWKSCYGFWVIQLTGKRADGGPVEAAGSFSTSAERFDSIVPRYVESTDVVTKSPKPFEPIVFDLTTINPWSDRLYAASFSDSKLCVTVDRLSDELGVFVGGERTPVGRRFDPETLGPCLPE